MIRTLCHFMTATADRTAIIATISQFQAQGWDFVTVYTEGNYKLHGYIFQKSPPS
ncbi:hypothetical protein NEF87_001739 [Candidatus Lokiarchaeum ossiferum]|uniref:DUF4177 domain-containing protein n=1 Tax=Candidatus Lokiarchaeum ossiferum TaxID=2951803 RepID=A0ABY6HSA9_9ARCH|nr:hypothetical protein NEF87_001739 [Candidatus Lokiarchaeum sp. B-35]